MTELCWCAQEAGLAGSSWGGRHPIQGARCSSILPSVQQESASPGNVSLSYGWLLASPGQASPCAHGFGQGSLAWAPIHVWVFIHKENPLFAAC